MPGLLRFGIDKLLFSELIEGTHQMNALSKSVSDWRVAQGKTLAQRDLFAALLEAKDPETGRGFTHEELISEAGLLIIGGSDTTITAITANIFYLLHYPSALSRLQQEIRGTFSDVETIRIGPQLSSCRYLLACIDETMRLSPSIGSLLPREVLPGGIIIDDEWFPPGIDIGVPHYTLHHNEAYFPDSFAYKPERWLGGEPSLKPDITDIPSSGAATGQFEDWLAGAPNATKSNNADTPEADLALAQSAFTPFGVGRTSCIGKYLAYQEMSLVLARMVWLYDMRIQPGTTAGEGNAKMGWGRTRKNEFQLLDRFVSMHSGPMVEFRSRRLSAAASG